MKQVVQDRQDARTRIAEWRGKGLTSCLVPTMGGIHGGHLALMERARAVADRVVVSIYVNPTQFAANEDFDSYPRGLEADMASIGQRADMVYAPVDLYHPSHATQVNPAGAALGLESEFRPHFFTGVATVVLKLLNQLPTDSAIFGQKDYQQLAVVRQLVRDLDLPVEILDHPTVREADGLALSSRNIHMAAEHRAIAPQLQTILRRTAQQLLAGTRPKTALADGRDLLRRSGFTGVDYLQLCNPIDLQSTQTVTPEARLLGAVHLGAVRLIDNIALGDVR